MPALTSRTTTPLVKLMLIGHSGAGKTGALTSLARAGYRIRIIDLDSGLDALVNHLQAEEPAALSRIDYMEFRDSIKVGPAGPMVQGAPRAFVNAVKAMDKWEDGSCPAEWGPESILVIDSLTNLGRAAFWWAKAMNPGAKEPRQWYFAAQSAIEDVIATATAEAFGTNLIIMSHIDLIEAKDGTVQGFASSIGKALGPKIPRYFNTLVALETKGQGKQVKRTLKTLPTSQLILKNPAPMKIEAEYPIETGLADLFSKLSGKT
jgi:hypothetical protein